MRALTMIIRRNLALFRSNKLNILLSFASILVVMGLYVLFLREFFLGIMSQSGIDPAIVNRFTDRLMFSGLLIVVNTTTCFGVIQISVNDTEQGIKRDYRIAPVSPFTLMLGYWMTSIVISFSFTLFTMAGGEFYFASRYGFTLPINAFIKAVGIIIVSSGINSAILLCFAQGMKNTTTFSTFGNLYGTVIGFLAGAYLPYYFYPGWLKPLLFYFPPAQSTSIMRQVYLGDMQEVLSLGHPPGFSEKLLQSLGVHLKLHGTVFSISQQLCGLLLALAFLLLLLYFLSQENTKK